MNTFKDKFQNEIEEELKISPIIKLVIKANADKYLCVVEGKTDQDFYKHSCIKVLQECEYVFRRQRDTSGGSSNLVGKESVIDVYKYLKRNLQLCKHLKSCIFIVDHDFDGVVSRYYEIDKHDAACINTTPYHSMESFFVEESNLSNLLIKLDVNRGSIESILSRLKNLAIITTEYFALRGSITYAYNCFEKGICRKVKYSQLYNREEIFGAPGSGTINEDYLGKEINNMYKAIQHQRVLIEKYHALKKWINGQPIYIQGHLAYDYLEYYVKEICGIDFDNTIRERKDLVGTIDIKMKITGGNGKVLADPLAIP